MALAAVMTAVSAPIASADVTRAQYVAQAEPVCAAASQEVDAIVSSWLKSHRKLAQHLYDESDDSDDSAKEKRLERRASRAAGRLILRAWEPYWRMVDQLALISPPVADAAVLGQWIESYRVLLTDGQGLARILIRGNSFDSKKYAMAGNRQIQLEDETDALVAGFGFHACLLDKDEGEPPSSHEGEW